LGGNDPPFLYFSHIVSFQCIIILKGDKTMDLTQYIKFPLQDREWIKKVIFGCIIFLVPVLNIIIIGYFIKCIEMGREKRQSLPEWDNWTDIIRDGFLGLVIAIIYLVIPIILAQFLSVIPIAGIFLSSIILILIGAVIPIAIANYSIRRDFKDAFEFAKIIYRLNHITKHYFTVYILMTLATVIGIFFILMMPLFAFLGILLMFYLGIVFSNLVGMMFQDTLYN